MCRLRPNKTLVPWADYINASEGLLHPCQDLRLRPDRKKLGPGSQEGPLGPIKCIDDVKRLTPAMPTTLAVNLGNNKANSSQQRWLAKLLALLSTGSGKPESNCR